MEGIRSDIWSDRHPVLAGGSGSEADQAGAGTENVDELKENANMKYVCEVCGWVYDEEEQGKKWEEVGDDFECPLCAVGKDQFSPEE